MSSASVTSTKREKQAAELTQELEAIRALNGNMRAYLEHLRLFKKNLIAMNDNCKQLSKVNSEWIETLSRK